MYEKQVLGAYVSESGTVVGRAVAHEADGGLSGPCGRPAEYCDMPGVWARSIRSPYRQGSGEWFDMGDDNAVSEALERFLDEYSHSEALEMWQRYLRVFHPTIVARVKTLRTGYSQSCWEEVAVWSDAAEVADADAEIDNYVTVAGALARQQWCVVYSEALTHAACGECGVGEVEAWSMVDHMYALYLEEFNPWPTAVECVQDLIMPDGAARFVPAHVAV